MLQINSIKYYVDRDKVPVRKAQRYREKLGIEKHIDAGATGVWILTERQWQKVKSACMDASLKRKRLTNIMASNVCGQMKFCKVKFG